MSGKGNHRRLWYAVGGVLIVAFLVYGASSFKSNLTAYVSFEQAMASGHKVQVAGSLVEGSTRWVEDTQKLAFTMVDEHGVRLPVVYSGTKPGNFEEATEIVAIGSYRDGVFHADQLLVKCPSKYQGIEGSAGEAGPEA